MHRSRTIPISEFFVGPKRSVLGEDELIAAVWVPVATGPQVFTKVGTRNAMVIAVCSFALALHPPSAGSGTGIGSAGPVPLQAHAAERFLEGHLEETGAWESRAPLGRQRPGPFRPAGGGGRPADRRRAGQRRLPAARPSRSWAGERCRGAGRSTGEDGRESIVHRERRAPRGRRRRSL